MSIFRLAAILVVSFPLNVWSAGFQTLEQGTEDMGRAMVGFASAANTAATVAYNPAGMSEFSSPELATGFMGILGEANFSANSNTTASGGNGHNALDNGVAPGGLFYLHPLDEDVTFGISVTAPFVGSLDYGKNWAGRYSVRSFSMATYALMAALSYELGDKWSIGFQGGAVYATLDQTVMIDQGATDGRLQIDDADQFVPWYGAGVTWEPLDKTRIGATWVAAIDLDNLDGDVKTTGVGPGFASDIDLEFTLPQIAVLSVAQEVTDKLTLYADLSWGNFSEFDSLQVDLSGGAGTSVPTHFRDSRAYGVALAYQWTPAWKFNTGISYASSPVSQKNRNPVLPFDRQIRYGTGVTYQWREDINLAVSYQYLDAGDGKFNVTQANGDVVAGDFRQNQVQFLAFSLRKTF